MSDFTWHLNIEQMQILFVTSQFLLKGHKLLIFFAFFLKISETLKAHISGTEADINKRQRAFFLVFNCLSYKQIKNYIKNFDA